MSSGAPARPLTVALLGGGTERAAQRGRDLGHALVVKAMTDAFLSCHIPVKLLY